MMCMGIGATALYTAHPKIQHITLKFQANLLISVSQEGLNLSELPAEPMKGLIQSAANSKTAPMAAAPPGSVHRLDASVGWSAVTGS